MSTQLRKVAGFLRKNNTYPGVTASQIAKATKVPRDSVLKRISDLRVLEGHTIYSNVKKTKVTGRKVMYYRFAV